MPRERGREVWRDRIEGGYRRISVVQLCMSWSLYRSGRISRRDVRVWFACHELEERRCLVERGGKVSLTAEEIGAVCGGLAASDVRAALRSLEQASLLRARKSRMSFARSIRELREVDQAAANDMLSRITNRRRVIRVPRRLVRALAEGMSKAVIATVFAHLIRCLYFQAAKNRYRVDGRCKASWIAEVFGVSERAVMTGRRRLVDRGWLIVLESSQWELNRYGLRLAVELDWSARPIAPRRTSSCPPRETAGRTSCPKANSTLLRKNRTLGRGPSGIGVRRRTKRGRGCWPGKLEVRDLQEPERLETIRQRLVRTGAVSNSEADRLRVFAAAAHALRVGEEPCGLFFSMVRDGHWHHINQHDEEGARRTMRLRSDENSARKRPYSAQLEAGPPKRHRMHRVSTVISELELTEGSSVSDARALIQP